MIALFTTLKPSDDGGIIDTIQYNALMSWLHCPLEVMVFGDEWAEPLGTLALDAAYKELPGNIRRVDHQGLNAHGTPLIAPMFRFAGEVFGPGSLLCYINGDIILLPSFAAAVERIRKMVGEYLVVGKRTNFSQQEKLEFGEGWDVELMQQVEERGYDAVSAAIDYFIHTYDLWSGDAAIPEDLTLARFYWDNHLTWLAGSRRRVPVVDATNLITAIHQDHPPITSFEAPEAKDNAGIVKGMMAGVEHCTHYFHEDGRLL
jgi:hypothetical protein